jgi:glycosyltransferase involved in cell wall biosynthesis
MHVISTLDTGGAETFLYRLVTAMDPGRFENVIVSMTDGGDYAPCLAEAGIRVFSLGLKRSRISFKAVPRLHRLIGRERPSILQTWLYHADLLGSIAGQFPPRAVIWNVRSSGFAHEGLRLRTRGVARICSVLSHWIPRRIICGSEAARRDHATLGYDAGRLVAIPNGFDIQVFKPDPAARQHLREQLGVPADAILVGLIGRWNPLKDHRNFVNAAALVARQYPLVRFVLAGLDVTGDNAELRTWIEAAGIRDRTYLLGPRQDIPRIDAALDVACLSSYVEGFPNVVGEAMASGVPCVVTDVGDAARLVGDTGVVVPPRDAISLARGLQQLIDMPSNERTDLGLRARNRIAELFSITTAASRYAALYETVMGAE